MSSFEYVQKVLGLLPSVVEKNAPVIREISQKIVEGVSDGKFLMVAGSGHSAIFAMELYHRAGGPSFVLPVVSEKVLPLFGPALAREAERRPESMIPALLRMRPVRGEMLWICSQSGINASIVELALEASKLGLETVGFTSVAHSSSAKSRHSSGKRLMEVVDQVVDLGGVPGDALLPIEGGGAVGPFSTLSALIQAHAILSDACRELESRGVGCVYTSVNTAGGEDRNLRLEEAAARRDDRLRVTSAKA